MSGHRVGPRSRDRSAHVSEGKKRFGFAGIGRRVGVIVLAVAVAPAARAENAPVAQDKQRLEVTIGEVATPDVEPGEPVAPAAIVGPEASSRGMAFFELSPYRGASVKWSEGMTVEVHLFGEMKSRKRSGFAVAAESKSGDFLLADCGRLPAGKTSWDFDPGALVCQGDFVDRAAVIEIRVRGDGANRSDRAIYLRVANRRFPFVGSDLGIALTLTQPLKAEGELDKGFELSDGLSFYYAVSRFKSERWRGIATLAALDHVRAAPGETGDPKDFELGLGLGALFKSNGFLDSNAGMSLAAGIGYNFMVPDSSQRWYWFVGVGANFDRSSSKSAGGSK